MVVPYRERDIEIIRGWHERSGFDYPFPDLGNPLFCLLGVSEANGVPVAAAGVRLLGEAYLWMDATASAKTKVKALIELHRDLKSNAQRIGLDQVVCHLPPEIDQAFSTRLRKFGWNKSVWENYAINI